MQHDSLSFAGLISSLFFSFFSLLSSKKSVYKPMPFAVT